MRCSSCGFENPKGLKFCGECGVPLKNPCTKCGFENPPRFKFCGECGMSLTDKTQALKPAETDNHKFTEVNKETTPLHLQLDKPQSYIPQHLADKILAKRRSIEGERKLLTVLFADVKGSTSIGETLDPEEHHSIIEKSYGISMKEIHRFEGSVNQFLGDGFMALFGAPIAHEDHAIRAIHSAVAIQKSMAGYSEELKKNRNIDFKMRIGINTGTVVVGNIGDDLKMDYTAIGDTVNLASRMEQIAQPGNIMVAEDTYKIAKDHFKFNAMGALDIKGKYKKV
jgi:class 3 adenylate cyclase